MKTIFRFSRKIETRLFTFCVIGFIFGFIWVPCQMFAPDYLRFPSLIAIAIVLPVFYLAIRSFTKKSENALPEVFAYLNGLAKGLFWSVIIFLALGLLKALSNWLFPEVLQKLLIF